MKNIFTECLHSVFKVIQFIFFAAKKVCKLISSIYVFFISITRTYRSECSFLKGDSRGSI
ncbi:MAG: hypothetical protein BGO44_03430 [Legionella sp. 39-23]|nr:MAG: hypothetical protein BGO44_03430 [Legionella sp. 39-23]